MLLLEIPHVLGGSVKAQPWEMGLRGLGVHTESKGALEWTP